MKDNIRYSKKRRQYCVDIVTECGGHKQFVYGVDRYGKDLAYLIARKSLIEKRRVHDFYITYGDITKFYVYSKKYGVCVVIIDTEDLHKVLPHKLSVYKSRYTYYAGTKIGSLHRVLFDNIDDGIVIDHRNKNGLDNRKKNLRPVTISINNKNCKIRTDNTTGIRGVSREGDIKYRASWIDDNYKLCSKTFSISKYGEDKAREMAINCRLKMEKLYNYTAIQEGSETTSNIGTMFVAIR